MTNNQGKILFLAEAKAGESVYTSGEYWVFLSGKSGREVHGVGVIIHSSLLQSILAVKAISFWLIMVQIKILFHAETKAGESVYKIG